MKKIMSKLVIQKALLVVASFAVCTVAGGLGAGVIAVLVTMWVVN